MGKKKENQKPGKKQKQTKQNKTNEENLGLIVFFFVCFFLVLFFLIILPAELFLSFSDSVFVFLIPFFLAIFLFVEAGLLMLDSKHSTAWIMMDHMKNRALY